MIITISREFGSGGKEIGKRLADALKLSYYDSEIISLIAKETGMSEEYIENISEKGIYPLAFQFAKSFAVYSPMQNNQTEILIKERKIIEEIAKKDNCIIVGRGANVILKEFDTIDLFVYANMQSKIKRCKEKANSNENLTDKQIEKKIIKINKDREKLNSIISNEVWGRKENYDLCINTSDIEIKSIIPALQLYIENYFRRTKE